MAHSVKRPVFKGAVASLTLAVLAQLLPGAGLQAQTPGCIEGRLVAAGGEHSLLVDAWSSVWSWGANDHGQLGLGSLTRRNSPTLIEALPDVVSVAAGDAHSLAVRRDGTVWAWGNNSDGQLGDGTTVSSSVPIQVLGLAGVTAVAAGGAHSMALRSDGAVLTWGDNSRGQLGNGSQTDSSYPGLVSELGPSTRIAAGGNHSLALGSDYVVRSWGANSFGQLGNGSNIDSPTASPVVGLSDVREIGAGSRHSIARRNHGPVLGWGDNSNGQLGTAVPASSSVPVSAAFLGPVDDSVNWLNGINLNVTDPINVVDGGGSHSAGLSQKWKTWTWGSNSSGQLGYSSVGDSPVPAKLGTASYKSVSAGGAHTLMVGSNDSIWAVGENSGGQVGDATFTDRKTITSVGCPLSGSPSKPTNIIATPGDSEVTLTWDPPSSSGSGPITSYTINSSDRRRLVVPAPPGGEPPTQAKITGLTNGKTYVFTVFATNAKSFGPASVSSNSVVPRALIPSPPRQVSASGGDSSAAVSWLPPELEGASAVTSYTATASPGGAEVTVTGSPPPTTASFTGLTNGTAYTFTVKAVNSHGSSLPAGPTAPVIASAIPDAPTNVTAEAGDGLAIVRWQPGSNGGAPISSVRVTASPGGKTVEVRCPVSSATVTGLTNGVPYTFSVSASNSTGSSLPAETALAVTPIPRTSSFGYYTDGAKTRFGNLISPSPADPQVFLRGVGTEWLDFDMRSKPVAQQQSGLTSYMGTFDSWPGVSDECTPLTDSSIEAMDEWGANIVRVPLSSMFWGNDNGSGEPGCQVPFPGYRTNVDSVVASITARGMVALLDLHANQRVPCSNDLNRLHPMAANSALAFWESVSRRYVANPLVAFELYNEPHTNYLNYGQGEWALWLQGGSVQSCPKAPTDPTQGTCPGGDGGQWVVAGMQQMYNTIRTVEASSGTGLKHLIFVGGNRVATRPPAPEFMIRDQDGSLARNLVYAVHHYSGALVQVDGRYYTQPSCWPYSNNTAGTGCFKTWVDFSVANSVPVAVTEFGWNYSPDHDPYSPTAPKPSGQQQNENVICSATNAGFGWMGYRWSSDHDHLPSINQYYGLLANPDQQVTSFEPNASGLPVKRALSADPATATGKAQVLDLLDCS